MCGFIGVLNLNRDEVDTPRLEKMRDQIAHRGPDDEGLYVDHNLGFGFRRLSIIDLESGHQPMTTADGRYTIVFNGEIYNYVELKEKLEALSCTFSTHSDTEVLLMSFVHYGRNCVQHLNGMFAFAIWDRVDKELFIARDRLGIKPFYYYFDGEKFVFGSEIKAIVVDRTIHREPNYEAIADYLSFSYVPDDKTFFKNIYKLMPGHYGTISEQIGLELEEYWDLDFASPPELDESEYVAKLNLLLQDAVHIHLRSDVTVGCHLSGGLDSSTVASLASQFHDQQIKTFSGKFTEDEFYDETKYAKIVSKAANTEYLETSPSIDFFLDNFHKIVWHMDEPAVGPGIIPQFSVCQLAGDNVKVVLGGQGGDEIFGGYPRYFLTYDAAAKLNNNDRNQTLASNSGFRRLIHKLRFVQSYAKQHGIRTTVKKVLRRMNQDSKRADSFEEIWRSFCTSIDLNNPVISEGFRGKIEGYQVGRTFARYLNKGKSDNVFNQMLYHDTKAYLPGLLQVEDRTSMAVSIESRVPLLDYRIVEMAARIPVHLKVKKLEPKYIFKRAIKGIIPKEVWERKDKKGFPTPIQIWFKQNPSLIKSVLFDRAASERGIFNPIEISKLLESSDDNSWLLWSLLNVEMWFKIFIDEDSRFIDSEGRPHEKVDY